MINRLSALSVIGMLACSTEAVPSSAKDASVPPPDGFKGNAIPANCGNGELDVGEFCDDGFADACGPCNADCSAVGTGPGHCGDGELCRESEVCDDGFNDACGTCNADCSAVGTGPGNCGDGDHCPEYEECDDGFSDACGTCNADCSAAGTGSTCGDGELCPETEVCDDGFADACGPCNADCSAVGTGPGHCGDGELCQESEVCDDGFNDACGTCNADCSAAGSGATCGDGELCPETETCENDLGLGCDACACPETYLSPACGGVTSDGRFHATQVYMFGTVLEDDFSCGGEAIAHWSTPNTPFVGGHCHDYRHVIRPSDGRLLYIASDHQLREFHCDECPGWTVDDPYPQDVIDNDSIIATPPCNAGTNRVDWFLVSPEGFVLHQCFDDPHTWYDSSGTVAYSSDTLTIAFLGAEQTALAVESAGALCILDLNGGTCTPVTGTDAIGGITVRALGAGGFWLVRVSGSDSAYQRWRIDGAGNATLDVTYASIPSGLSVISYSEVLDAGGNLFTMAIPADGSLIDLIVRFPADGSTAEIVYSEADDHDVKLHISSYLFTGP